MPSNTILNQILFAPLVSSHTLTRKKVNRRKGEKKEACMQVHRSSMKSLATAIALILAISLVYGCTKENKDLAKLQEENRDFEREAGTA